MEEPAPHETSSRPLIDAAGALARDPRVVEEWIAGDVQGAVLLLARTWHCVVTGAAEQAQPAAHWAIARMPFEHRGVVFHALRERSEAPGTVPTLVDSPEVRAYAAFVVGEIMRALPAGVVDGAASGAMLPPTGAQHPESPGVGAPHEVQPTSWVKAVMGPFIFLALLAWKFGKYAILAVKGVKFFGTAASMLVSIAAYALVFGWPFAAGFVVLMFVHELGHALQLRREGIPAGPIVFIPFLGAAVAMKEMPRNAAVEARVGIAGPILGTIGAGATHAVAVATGSDLLLALAFTAYFLNLFNLVPVSPLDGGRIAAALSPALWIGGLIILAGLFFVSPNPLLLLIVVMGAIDSWGRWRRRHEEAPYYAEVSPSFRTGLGVTWIGLMVLLVLLMDASHVPRSL